MNNHIYNIDLSRNSKVITRHKIVLSYPDDSSFKAVKTFFRELANRYFPEYSIEEVIMYSSTFMYADTDVPEYKVIIAKVDKIESIYSLS